MPSAGYNSSVKGTGTPTAMVAEATTELVADTVFQITASARRILDPDAALTVLVNAAPVASGFTVDYLFGKVTFSPALAPGDVVTLTGNYLPAFEVLEGREASVSMKRDIGDVTIFHATDKHRKKLALLLDASGTIGILRAFLDLLEGGNPASQLFAILTDGTRKVIEYAPGGQSKVFRAWVRFETEDVEAAVDALVTGSLSWQCVTSENGKASFSLDTP